MEYKVLISLGSNSGNRCENIKMAVQIIQAELAEVIAISSLYETQSWGYEDADYLNAGICVSSKLGPEKLMESLLEVETRMGRVRTSSAGYQARTIDLDIILIEGLIVESLKLTVPHPRMLLRKFVLKPLAEIAPDWVHEIKGLPLHSLLAQCKDEAQIKCYGKLSLYRN